MTSRRAPPDLTLVDARAPAAEEIWRALEERASPPYFLTWGWIRNWLGSLPRGAAPALATLSTDGMPVAACFLGRRRVLRHLLVTARTLHLNSTGESRWDELTIEHNAILCSPAARLALADFVEALPDGWDELHLPALSRSAYPAIALAEPLPGYLVRIDAESSAPYVDLSKVRGAGGDYLALLGPETRAQIRRSQRGFGAIDVRVASDVAEALEMYEELVALHGRRWHSRGLPGAFADPWFERFHRTLIGDRFAHGEIQLLRVRAGNTTIGCLYNLISSGRVLFYQSGFAAFDDPRLKPGYVCHAQAVQHNAALGHAVYDLLGGASRYKRSLATDESGLVWARVQRRLARFEVEERLRSWARAAAFDGRKERA